MIAPQPLGAGVGWRALVEDREVAAVSVAALNSLHAEIGTAVARGQAPVDREAGRAGAAGTRADAVATRGWVDLPIRVAA